MEWDLFIVVVSLLLWGLGWSIRIYIDLIQAGWVLFMVILLFLIYPYFDRFVYSSSVEIKSFVFYGVAATIYFTTFVLIGYRLNKRSRNKGWMERLTGGFVFMVTALFSLLVLIMAAWKEGWISLGDSVLLESVQRHIDRIGV